jgi:hypothetical protein
MSQVIFKGGKDDFTDDKICPDPSPVVFGKLEPCMGKRIGTKDTWFSTIG